MRYRKGPNGSYFSKRPAPGRGLGALRFRLEKVGPGVNKTRDRTEASLRPASALLLVDAGGLGKTSKPGAPASTMQNYG